MSRKQAGPLGGRGKKASDALTSFPVRGTGRSYSLARLKRDQPDLAKRVMAGEMSTYAAAIEAGFRACLVRHPATVEGFLRAAKKHLRRVSAKI
jgi:hypothetical protein